MNEIEKYYHHVELATKMNRSFRFSQRVVCSPAFKREFIRKADAKRNFYLGWDWQTKGGEHLSIRDCAPKTKVILKFGKRLQKRVCIIVLKHDHTRTGDEIRQANP